MEAPDLKGEDKVTNVLSFCLRFWAQVTVLKDSAGSGKLTYDHKWPQ